MSFELSFTDGRKAEYDTYEAAVAAFEAEYPKAEVGHDGDLSDGGDRTLCWADEASSINDDGAKAAASIHRVAADEEIDTRSDYVVKTDGFEWDDKADSLDDAIEMAFAGEGLGKIVDQASLEQKFEKYVADGGWCWIECDGERVLEIGKC